MSFTPTSRLINPFTSYAALSLASVRRPTMVARNANDVLSGIEIWTAPSRVSDVTVASVVVARMARAVQVGGWVVAQEPITSAGRVGGQAMSMPDARHPDIGAMLPALARDAGLEVTDAWAEAPAGAGPGPVAEYLESLTEVDPGDDPVVLPPLVTVVARRPG